jgi:RNA polymerase sigma-70 factor (ECF subfamily)
VARTHAVVARDYALVWRFLRRLGVPQDGVDDAAHLVFARVLARAEIIVPGCERAYLMKAAYHAAFESQRQGQRARSRAASIEPDELSDPALASDEALEQRRRRELLDRALDELPPEARAVFTLFELEEMTFTEIAEALSLPRGTVASRLRRARELFTQAVRRLQRGAGQ